MRIKTALATSAITAGMLAGIGAPLATAEEATTHLGQQGTLTNGDVVQGWTIAGLKPSSDVIPYQPVGTLWEATATNQAIQGSVTPIISNLNARAADGQNYRVLFGVATAQGVNPSTLAQGEQTTGKVYFDVTGANPDSVVYTTMSGDQLTWVAAPPPAAPAQSPSISGSAAVAPVSPAPAADTETAPAPAAGSEGTPVTEGSQGTPATPAPAVGSEGTPVTEGSQGTPVTDGTPATPAPAAGSEGTPVPDGTPATPAPAVGSEGTPVTEGSQGTPAAPAPAAAGTPVTEGSQGTPVPANEGTPTAVTAPTTTVLPIPEPAS